MTGLQRFFPFPYHYQSSSCLPLNTTLLASDTILSYFRIGLSSTIHSNTVHHPEWCIFEIQFQKCLSKVTLDIQCISVWNLLICIIREWDQLCITSWIYLLYQATLNKWKGQERRLCYSETTLNHMSEEIRHRIFPFSLSQQVLWISLLSILMETVISEEGL